MPQEVLRGPTNSYEANRDLVGSQQGTVYVCLSVKQLLLETLLTKPQLVAYRLIS